MKFRALLLMLLKLNRIHCSSFDGLLQAAYGHSGGTLKPDDAAFRPPTFDLRDSTPTREAFEALADGSVGPTAVGIQSSMSATKTGTTIVGVLCPSANAVVLAADTRATNGETVADKRCEKIHRLAPNIYCCGAGTAADAEQLTRAVAIELTTQRWALRLAAGPPPVMLDEHDEGQGVRTDGNGNPAPSASSSSIPFSQLGFEAVDATSRVAAAHCLLKKAVYQGHRTGSLSCALVLGGVDAYGFAKLVQVHGGGSSTSVRTRDLSKSSISSSSSDGVPSGFGESIACGFAALGSGELAAVSALESHWQPDLTLDETVALATMAARAGVNNDLGSGGGVDVCVIAGSSSGGSDSSGSRSGGNAWVKYMRGYRPEDAAPPLPYGVVPAASLATMPSTTPAGMVANLGAASRSATSIHLGPLPPLKGRSPLSGPNPEPPEELELI